MVKKSLADSPFYYKEGVLSIYGDRIVLPQMDGRVVYFSDINEIIFEKLDFTLYLPNAKNSQATIYMNNVEDIELFIPLSGYYALKNFYQKGIKTNGKKEISIVSGISLVVLVIFLVTIYVFVWSK